MQTIFNNFNPIHRSGSIIPTQEFIIYSEPQPDIKKIEVQEQEEIEIQDLEILLRNKLPQYYITGTLEHGQELHIQNDNKTCHIHIFDENKLHYRYSTNEQDYWTHFLLDLLSLFLVCFTEDIWYCFNIHLEEKAIYIGQDIQQLIEDYSIDLVSYTTKNDELLIMDWCY